jgi:hypothetical protein
VKRFSFLILLLFAKAAWSAPAISSVSGTFSGDANDTSAHLITIDGAGFGSKSPAKPAIWFTAETSSQPTSLGVATAWSGSHHMERCSTSPRSGSWAACSDSGWRTDVSNARWDVQYDFNLGYGAKYYLNYARRVTYTEGANGTNANWKWQRWWENEGAQPDHYVGTQGPVNETVQQEGNGTVIYLNGTWIHPADRGQTWTKEEYRWNLNSAQNVADGGFKIWMWDNNISCPTWKSDAAGTAGGTPDYMFIEDDPSQFTPAAGNAYLDDIYADSTWSRVVVGSSSTYDASHTREMCIPASWSTTQVTCYFHEGDFTTSQAAWVYVCDSNDSCSSGFSITIGTTSGGGNTAPTVDAGNDQTITLPTDTASLDGTVSDDVAVVGSTWTKVSGPSTVTFGNSHSVDTTATFGAAGTYVLQLAASDGTLETTDTVTITVNAAPTPAVGSGHLRGSGRIRISGPTKLR